MLEETNTNPSQYEKKIRLARQTYGFRLFVLCLGNTAVGNTVFQCVEDTRHPNFALVLSALGVPTFL